MKLKKLQAAFKKAQAAETLARAAYEKLAARAKIISKTWADAKAAYKAARKELKRTRKEAAAHRAAQESARRNHDQSAAVLAKVERKVKKAEKKRSSKPRKNTRSQVPVRVKRPATVARKPKATGSRSARPNVTVPIPAQSAGFPENAAAQP